MPTVLLVNDLQETLNLYADLLESDKYELEVSNYEFEVPAMIERLKPDLIIMDFQVEQQNRTRGWQLFDKIKLSPNLCSIPVIICTPALSDVRDQEHYLQDQGIVIFYKPFKLDLLVKKVQEILEMGSTMK
jgi:CheY-like chemotaxis protein